MKTAKFFLLAASAISITVLAACTDDEEQADSRFFVADRAGQNIDNNGAGAGGDADLASGDAANLSGSESNAPGEYGDFNAEDQEYLQGFGRRITNAGNFDPVYFPFDNYSVSPSEAAKVTAIANFVKAHAGTGVVVEGNCDERGTQEYNRGLGERRAQAVKEALMKEGVPEQCIATQSYGEDKPAVLGSNETAWARNRRADFVPVLLNKK